MRAPVSPNGDLKAALVVLVFAPAVVIVAAVLSKQAPDAFCFAFGVPLLQLLLLVSSVAHGGHSS